MEWISACLVLSLCVRRVAMTGIGKHLQKRDVMQRSGNFPCLFLTSLWLISALSCSAHAQTPKEFGVGTATRKAFAAGLGDPISGTSREGPADTHALLAAGAELSDQLDDDIVETDIGFRVTKSCFEKWGPGEFNRILYGAVREGARCLLDLQEKGKGKAAQGITNALRNALALESLRRRSPVYVTCENDSFDWGVGANEIQGRANTDPANPDIWINPKFPATNPSEPTSREFEVIKVQSLLFHEHIHNLGYAHGEDIEYSYGCQHCCFDNSIAFFNPKAKLLACRICTGNYPDRNDSRFLRDLMEYGDTHGIGSEIYKHFTRQAKLKHRDPEALAMLARIKRQVASPIGLVLARKIESQFQGNLSPYALTTLARIKEGNLPELPDEISASVESIAEAYRLLYGEHDSVATLDLLLARKSDLGRVLNRSTEEADTNVRKAIDELSRDVERLLDELGVNRFQDRVYPSDVRLTSQVAEELRRFLLPDEA